MQVNLDIVDWTRCEDAIENAPIVSPFKLTKDMMCAGGGLDYDACSVRIHIYRNVINSEYF